MHPPRPIPPLIPHVRYGSRPLDPDWLFFGAARQALKFLAQNLLQQHPGLLFIVPAYTCDSVVQALDEAGAEIAFVDIGPHLDMDIEAVSQVVHQAPGRKVAIVPTPLFGAPVRPYKALFPDCIVIEDRAQTVSDPDSQADYQLLSFGPGKQVSGMGGGALLGGQVLRPAYAALPQECGAFKQVALSLAGGLLLGPAWSLAGQKVTQHHSAQSLDKEARAIEVHALCDDRARWTIHSLQTWDPAGRIRIADAYRSRIPQALQFDLPPGRPYLRVPVRATFDGPGVSSGRMYQKVVQRAEDTARCVLPGARALMEASLLPTHHRVSPEHVAWYADTLAGLAARSTI